MSVQAYSEIYIADRPDEAHARRLVRIEMLERVLDRQFRLPIVGQVGLDGVIGLIPGIGDAATAAISGYLILEAHRAGARKRTLARMGANVGVDLALGLVPIVGDIADFFHKSNTKNLALLKRELTSLERPHAMTDDTLKPEPAGKRLGHRSPDNSTPPADQHREGHTSDHRAAAASLSTDEESGAQPIPHPVKQDEETVQDAADRGRGGSVR